MRFIRLMDGFYKGFLVIGEKNTLSKMCLIEGFRGMIKVSLLINVY